MSRIQSSTPYRTETSVSFLTPSPPPPRPPRKMPSETTLHPFASHQRVSLAPNSAPPRIQRNNIADTRAIPSQPTRRHRSHSHNPSFGSHHTSGTNKSTAQTIVSLEDAADSEDPVSAWSLDAFDAPLLSMDSLETKGPRIQFPSEKPIIELEVQSPFSVTVPVALHPGVVRPRPIPRKDSDAVDPFAKLDIPQDKPARRRLVSESHTQERRPIVVETTPQETTDGESTAGSLWDDGQLQSPRDDEPIPGRPIFKPTAKPRPISAAPTTVSDAPSALSTTSSTKSYNGVRTDTLTNRIPYNFEENEGPALDVCETVGYIHMQQHRRRDNNSGTTDVDPRLKAVSLGFPFSLRPRNIPNARAIFSSSSTTSVVDYRFIRFAGLIPSMRPLRHSIDRVFLTQLGPTVPIVPIPIADRSTSAPPNQYHVYGRVLVPFDAGQWSFVQECWVIDLPAGLPLDMILGMDWMEKYDARIEVSLDGMRISGAAVVEECEGAGQSGRPVSMRVASDTYNSMPPDVSM